MDILSKKEQRCKEKGFRIKIPSNIIFLIPNQKKACP